MNTHASLLSRPGSQRGISLFEMLVTVALLGIMASLAMPLFGAQTDVYADIKAKRNAQEIITECISAEAAGVAFVVTNDLPATLANFSQGAVAESGAFQGRFFGLKNLSLEDLRDAGRFLQVADRSLRLR